MKKTNLLLWNQLLLKQNNILINNNQFNILIKNYTTLTKDEQIKIAKTYPLIKILADISIEIGEVIIIPSSEEQIIELLNDFVSINKNGSFKVHQDIIKLQKWATILQIEIPNIQNSEGYICNNELINFYEDNNGIKFLQFKYRDNIGSSYLIYKFTFIHKINQYFLFRIYFI